VKRRKREMIALSAETTSRSEGDWWSSSTETGTGSVSESEAESVIMDWSGDRTYPSVSYSDSSCEDWEELTGSICCGRSW
jgi:hypothetical protein